MFAINYWAYPQALWLLCVIPLFLWGYRKYFEPRKLIIQSSYPSEHLPLLTRSQRILRMLPLFFYLVALVTGILALARPQKQSTWENQELRGQEILCLIDMSQSMTQVEGRIPTIQKYLLEGLSSFKGNRMGIILLGEEAFTYAPLTWDKEALKDLIARLQPGLIPAEGTAIGNAIALASRRIDAGKATSPSIILFSDGGNNRSLIAPMSATRLAQERDIPFTAIIWKPHPDSLTQLQQIKRDSLDWITMTEMTGGRTHFLPFDSTIPAHISLIREEGKAASAELSLRRVKELYPFFLMVSLLFLVLSFLLQSSSWSNPLEM